jgi:hypothetical protein
MAGAISFNLYGEERLERVPLRSALGIAFPVNGDGRHPASADGRAKFEAYFQKKGTKIKRKVEFSFKHDEDRVDLCAL